MMMGYFININIFFQFSMIPALTHIKHCHCVFKTNLYELKALASC